MFSRFTHSLTPCAVICALTAGVLAVPVASPAQSKTAIQVCAKRNVRAFRRFSTDAIEIMNDCQVDSLKDDERTDCAVDEDVLDDLDNAADKLRREVKKCDEDAMRALCPHSSRDDTELKETVLLDELGTTSRLRAFDADLYSTEYAGCPRPTGEISNVAEDCADRISRLVEDGLDELQKCLYKCELNGMRKSDADDCLIGSNANDNKVVECLDRTWDDLDDDLPNRCDTAKLTEIGCPFGTDSVTELRDLLLDRLFEEARKMSNGIFSSSCSSTGSSNHVGGETDPIDVTLYPSQTTTQIDCGQDLDAAFFGADDEVRLDADVDCSPAGLDSIGIIISASNVTFNGRGDHTITGPSRSSNRTGSGILIAPGAKNVTIKNVRQIQRYAVGILDSGDNDGLRVESSTVRRNKTAGILTTSPDVYIDRVKADRNGVGFDVSGDGSTLQDCRALRGTPLPGLGIRLAGTDDDLNGQVVRVNRCQVEENEIGIVLAAGPHQLEDNDVRLQNSHGIHVLSDGSKIESNSVKRNVGSGIVVDGDGNNITANSSDENIQHGFVVTGAGNDLNNNGAGSLTDNGNLMNGFWIAGTGTIVENNDAEANLWSGFVVDEATAIFKSNGANDNTGIGFDINVAGNTLDTNVAEDNGGAEFSIAADNIDDQGNRKNGSTFTFTLAGGDFE